MATDSKHLQYKIFLVHLRTHAGEEMHLSIISTSTAGAMIAATYFVEDFKQISARVVA